MRVAAYLRLSKDTEQDGRGVARQREDCVKLAEQRGWTLVTVIEDNDLSAAGRKPRPGFDRLLRMLADGEIDGVVAWSWDRLERNRRDSLRLVETGQEVGATVALVRGSDLDMSSPAGRLSADVLASVARHEIDQKSDRQRRATEQAASEGRRVGGRRAFGYELDMTIRADEAAALKRGYDEVLAGASLGAVARSWNAQGLLTPQGHEWISTTVARCLRKPTNAGLRAHKGEVVGPAAWDAVVDEGTWRAVQAVLRDPSRKTQGGPVALLTGVALCGTCGLTVHTGAGKVGARGFRTYRCRGMEHIARRADPIDEYVSAVAVERLSRDDARDLLAAQDRPDVAELHAEAERLRQQIDGLADAYARDEVTLSQMTRATAGLQARLDAVQAEMADSSRVDVLGPLVAADDVRAVWGELSTDRRRAVIDTLMTVTLRPAGRGTRTFRPESVGIDWR